MSTSEAELLASFGELTDDTPAPGLRVSQPRRGYRWGVEVYALVGFAVGVGAPAPVPVATRAVELGAGSGVVSLLLAARGVAVQGWDRDPAWVALARRNRRRSPGAVGGVHFGVADVRTLRAGADVDLVVTNPPWFDPGAGPLAPDPRKAAARTMLHGTVEDFVAAGLRLAPRVCVVTRAERLAALRVEALGAHVARRAWLPGGGVGLAELRRGPGPTREEVLDLHRIYAELGARPA